MEELIEHLFFKNFDWKHFKKDRRNFTYLEGIPSIEDKKPEKDDNDSSDDELNTLKETKTNNFLYNIQNFTYEDRNNIDMNNKLPNNIKESSLQYQSFKNDQSPD